MNSQTGYLDESSLFDELIDPAFHEVSPVVSSAEPLSHSSPLSCPHSTHDECDDFPSSNWMYPGSSSIASNPRELQYSTCSASSPAFEGAALCAMNADGPENSIKDAIDYTSGNGLRVEQNSSSQKSIALYWSQPKLDSLKDSSNITLGNVADSHQNDRRSAVQKLPDFNGRSSRGPRTIDHNGVLQTWYDAHVHYPFPTNEEKFQLSKESGNTFKQVGDWFNNRRSRKRDGPATLSGISNTLFPFSAVDDTSMELHPHFLTVNHATSSASNLSSRSGDRSHGLPHGRKGKRRIYSRLTTPNAVPYGITPSDDYERPWPCTFALCTKSSKNRYEWKRHESSHLVGSWVCMPDNTPIVGDSCGLCGIHDPPLSHFRQHFDISACLDKEHAKRAFCRKDKLQEHIYRVHLKSSGPSRTSRQSFSGTAWSSLLDQWQKPQDLQVLMPEALWCGFCGAGLSHWVERQEHVGDHLQSGNQLTKWQDFL